jgi:hypothetical protein
MVAACILALHSPDGSELLVQSDTIRVVKPIQNQHREHVAPGTNSVLYLGVRAAGFGVMETAAQVLQMLRDCPDANHPKKETTARHG